MYVQSKWLPQKLVNITFHSRTKWVKTNGQENKINVGVTYGVEHDLLVGKLKIYMLLMEITFYLI